MHIPPTHSFIEARERRPSVNWWAWAGIAYVVAVWALVWAIFT